MNILLTFDYELFFGRNSGTASACMIAPTEHLVEIIQTLGVYVTFYVDIGYLLRCKTLQKDMESYEVVTKQLIALHNAGHDLQLHIHPHWEDSIFKDDFWHFTDTRYRLHQFSRKEINDIISRYSSELKNITGVRPIAFRAGGWCIQPFDYFSDELYIHGIRIDSTIFKKGKRISSVQGFDFTNAPDNTSWRFDSNPLEIVENGRYCELPISNARVSPFFYWKFVAIKFFKKQMHKSYGDGIPISLSKMQIVNLLTRPTHDVVSMDGYKSILLEQAYLKYFKEYGCRADLVCLGHPKAATEFSLQKLKEFIARHRDTDRFLTTVQWYKESEKKSD